LKNIKKDDYMVSPFSDYINNIDELDLFNLLPTNPLYNEALSLYKKRIFTIDDVSEKLGVHRTTIHQWVTKLKTPYNVFRLENNYIISDGNAKHIPRYVKLNNDFLKLIGYYVSDGNASGNNLSFYFGISEKHYYDDVFNLMSKIFGLTPIKDKKKKNMLYLRYCSKTASHIFRILGGAPHNKHISKIIMELSPKKQLGLLSGLISGDGTISKTNSTVSYCTASLRLAWQVRNLFSRQNWASSIHIVKGIANFKGRIVKSLSYNISICGKEVDILHRLTKKGGKTKGLRRSGRRNFRFIRDNKLYMRIKSTSDIEYNGMVYDLTIDAKDNNEQSYMACGVLSHNSSHLLEDFDNKIAVIKEWARVLKVGGNIVLYLPDEQCYRKYCFLHNQGSNTAHKDENFSKEKLKKYAEQLGNLKVMLETDIIMDYSFAIVFRKTKAIVGE